MGNKLGRRRQVVDERYTKPQGLYVHKDVDHKKLRKLILESKLAPCYPGDEESCNDHEECPICFLYYPSLNRSRCCTKGICTECFLQMKNPNSTRPTQCPFCKTSNYAVEYRGVKTKEEKGLEQIEEQRVIEAKIRIRQQELQDEEDRMQKRLESSSSSSHVASEEVDCGSAAVPSYASSESDEIVSSRPSIRDPALARPNRDEDFDLDLEDIMVMEAIWLSIQGNGRPRNLSYDVSSEQYGAQCYMSQTASAPPPVVASSSSSSSSPSGGLACAIAALAERQQMVPGNVVSADNVLPGCNNSFYSAMSQQHADCYAPAESSSNVSPDCQIVVTRDDAEWIGNRGSDAAAEAGTSYSTGSSDTTMEECGSSSLSPLPPPPPPPPLLNEMGGPILPESFEEQMMLAMAVSLAEARAVTTGSTWQ
ncbi:unnamed protein product [Linum tenue]|uniref:RING-type domain-containing protein n=1 Tax=Linum tenue TaxID=586396 RepID=A0AAV0JIE0_9ROSI|nr:unnamed protein product [Linum tenue]